MHCDNLLTDTLGTRDSCRIYLPSAFTPNGDGINDIFTPAAFNVKSIIVRIYDDCDNMIYSSTSLYNPWAPQGDNTYNRTYYYQVQAITNENHHIGLCGEFKSFRCMPNDAQLHGYIFSDQIGYDGAVYSTNEVMFLCD
jgi:gliding motility-associated-like protein